MMFWLASAALAGSLRERGSGIPLSCPTWVDGVAVDVRADGAFDLPGGSPSVLVRCPDRPAHEGVPDDDGTVWVDAIPATEVVVYGDAVAGQRSAAELNRVAGSFGDPVRAIASLPGVARPVTLEGAIALRGAQGHHTAWRIDGVEVPALFHWGLGRSIVDPADVEHVTLVPAPTSAVDGVGLGGHLDVVRRGVEAPGLHGVVGIDPLDAGGTLHVALGGWDLDLGGRYGWLGAVVAGGAVGLGALRGLEASEVGWSYLGYGDGSLRLGRDVGPGRVRFDLLGADDTLRVNEPGEGADDDLPFDPARPLARRFVQGVVRWDQPRAHSHVAATFDHASSSLDGAGLLADLPEKGEVSGQSLSGVRRDRWGPVTTSVDASIRPVSTASWQDLTAGEQTDRIVRSRAGAGAEVAWKGLGWRLDPGARVDVFGDPSGVVAVPQPRVRLELRPAPRWTARWAVGRDAEPAPDAAVSAVLGDPGLGPERAWSTVGGVGYHAPAGASWSLDGWATHFEAIAAERAKVEVVLADPDAGFASLQALPATTLAVGRSAGVDLTVRARPRGPWFGWASLTLARSFRIVDGASFPADQDEPVSFVAVGGGRAPAKIDVSGRVRVGSGHPHTPLTPVYDAWSDAIDGLPGPTNSARLPPFFQLDVRAERTFVGRRSTTTAYLDVVNVLGVRNPLLATYDATYTRVVPVVWIPIVPVVGVRVAY